MPFTFSRAAASAPHTPGPASFGHHAIALALCALPFSVGAYAEDATRVGADIPGVVAAGTPIEFIHDGFKGTEGPIALPDGALAFTETQAARITRVNADGSVAAYLENTNGANGLAFNADGDLIAVQTADPKVGVLAPAAHAHTLVDGYEGARFGRPNDVVVDRQGGIYFTDSGVTPKEGQPAPAPKAVYYLGAGGKLQRIASDIERPNGIQLSPDEKTLYVANTDGEYLLAYEVQGPGRIGARCNFAKLAGWAQGQNGNFASGADGLAIDDAGRVYAATNVGIEVFTPAGAPLGVIALPRKPQNLAFAGQDKKSLYVVGRGAVYRIALQAAGYRGRAK